MGLVKYDLSSSDRPVAATLRFGKGRTGGEAVFVPSSTTAAELKGEYSPPIPSRRRPCEQACKHCPSGGLKRSQPGAILRDVVFT